ncbi:COP9 signalosome complex subunit 9-like [Protopterus annectens]|nr:COP9 signalosome complex subunit 9-like [Protopterus annectens]
MFLKVMGPCIDLDEQGRSSGHLMDLAENEKAAHSDIFNNFEDVF